MENVKDMVQAIARLHNFVINRRLKEQGAEEERSRTGPGYMPSVPHDENGDPVDTDKLFSGLASRGHSELRERMVDRVELLQLVRPVENRIKRKFMDNGEE